MKIERMHWMIEEGTNLNVLHFIQNIQTLTMSHFGPDAFL